MELRRLAIRFHGLLWMLAWAGLAPAATGVPLQADRWVIHAEEHRFEEHLGRPSLFIGNGIAWVEDSEFTDGVIEFDIAFTGARGFSGVAWRLVDHGNYEEFYIRPHQAGKPDANQYTPAFFGLTSWQLYHGPGYGAAADYKNNEWNHVKVIVSGRQAEVYIEDMEQPLLFIPDQKRAVVAGHVGLNAYFAPAHFSAFSFEALEKPELKGSPAAEVVAPQGAIPRWFVSDVFDASSLERGTGLSAAQTATRTWTLLSCEPSGLANLGSVHPRGAGKDTVFGRVNIESSRAQSKKLRFGFSDRAKVYLNGELLYSGDNGYRTRDYRYLGTIGWFDEVVLPLRKGENRLWIAVSEAFGGWGLQAAIEDRSGITVIP